MELLYVWIEDYKNIKKQGFNFSPEYHFNFDDETKELTVEKREGLPKNFFGENIVNVTAIVGENGVGKSTLLKFIGGGLFNTTDDASPFRPSNSLISIWKKDGIYTILRSSIYSELSLTGDHWKGLTVTFKDHPHLEPKKMGDENILQSGEAQFLRNNILSYYYSNYVYSSHSLNFPYSNRDLSTDRFLQKSQNISQYYSEEASRRFKYLNKKNQENLPSLDFIDNLDTVSISPINYDRFDISLQKLLDDKNKIKQITDILTAYPMPYIGILNFILYQLSNDSYFIRSKKDTVIEILMNDIPKISSDQSMIPHELDTFIKVLAKAGYHLQIHGMNRNNLEEYIQKYKSLYDKHKGKQTISINPSFMEELEISLNEDSSLSKLIEIFDKNDGIASYFLTIKFKNLSSGEDAFFSLLSRFTDLEKRLDRPAMILIDEGDLGFHPMWQQEYFIYLLKLFNSKKIFPHPVQIVIASHSPFILSDLPRQNVIFLEKDKSSGNTKVVEGISKSNTFGANIHTLFADAFFMEGGLIGKFAKEKINDIINILRPIILHSKSTYQAKTTKVESFFQKLIEAEIKEEHIQQLCTKYLDSAKKATSDKTVKQLKTWDITGDLLKYCQDHWEEVKDFRKQLLPIYEYTKTKLDFQTEQQQKEVEQIIDMIGDLVVKDKLEQMYFMALSYLNEENIQDVRIKELKTKAKKLGCKIIKE